MTLSEEFEPQSKIHGTDQEKKSEGHKIKNFTAITGLYVNYGDPATWTNLMIICDKF